MFISSAALSAACWRVTKSVSAIAPQNKTMFIFHIHAAVKPTEKETEILITLTEATIQSSRCFVIVGGWRVPTSRAYVA